jgi:oxygen-independent coproporphyrinogen-3 oxidase
MMSIQQKYNERAPRYTSYPAHPFWNQNLSLNLWEKHLHQSVKEIDLYIHVPFCEKLCWYCGCHREIDRAHKKENEFLNAIKKEWSLYLQLFKPQIHSIHFGGGTPTYLSPEHLDQLLMEFSPYKKEDFIGAMEIDPRTVQYEHLKVLKKYGFKRLSLGIQDFNQETQKAINRLQSFELVENVVSMMREIGFESINFDLIYGLPLQTQKTFAETLKLVQKLNPDMVSFFSYAHLPSKLANQKLIKENELPNNEEKLAIFEMGKIFFIKNGYVAIGLDHFAKPDNYLARAYKNNKLMRSFMGYTDQKSQTLIGLGPSAIGDSDIGYVQNKKILHEYYEDLKNQKLPLSYSHLLSEEDKVTKNLIMQIMCQNSIDKNLLVDADELKEFIIDGCLVENGDHYQITTVGKTVMRSLCARLDPYFQKSLKNQFSQTI